MSATVTQNQTLHRVTGLCIALHPKSGANWSRAQLQLETGKAWITGKFGIEVGEVLDVECTYNDKFKSYDAIRLIDDGGEGKVSNIVVTLKLIEILDGVGQVKARRLSEKFPELFQTLLNNPQVIADACGASVESVVEVGISLQSQRNTLSRVTKLANMGYPHALSKRIAISETAYAVAIKSPYAAIKHVSGLGWLIADEVGRKNGIKLDSPDRIAAGIEYHWTEKVRNDGHTKVNIESLYAAGELQTLLGVNKTIIHPVLEKTLIPVGDGWYTTEFARKNAETISSFFLGNV